MNEVQLIGNLGADPEIRDLPNGGKVANLRIATTEKWRDKQSGEQKEQTEWHSVAIFQDGLVGVVERFLKKGSKVFIRGALKTRKYQNKDGQDAYATEIQLRGFDSKLVMLDGRGEGGDAGDIGSRSTSTPRADTRPAQMVDESDEIPF